MSGELIDGRYELGERLGTGGMGEVYRARDRLLGREVAVKLITPPVDPERAGADEYDELLARFTREARAAAALDSPYCVTVHDHGTTTRSGVERPYLVMALVDGRTLERILRDEGRVPWRRALTWAGQLCAALAAAHSAGVVHRDIKPANVMVVAPDPADPGGHGTVQVLDFGIARFAEEVALDDRLTRTGAMPIGSVHYLAPERFRGERGDERGDLYALGCVLYELLVGRPPYVGTAAQVMYNHLHDVPLRPSRAVAGLPPAVERLVLRLMAADPADRPGDAARAGEEIRAALAAGAEPASPARPANPALSPATPPPGPLPATPSPAASRPARRPPSPAARRSHAGRAPGRAAAPWPALVRTPAPQAATARRTSSLMRPLAAALAMIAAVAGGVGLAVSGTNADSHGEGAAPPAPVASSAAPSPEAVAELAGPYQLGAAGSKPALKPMVQVMERARAAALRRGLPGPEIVPLPVDGSTWSSAAPRLLAAVGDTGEVDSDDFFDSGAVLLSSCDVPDSLAATDYDEEGWVAQYLDENRGARRVFVRAGPSDRALSWLIDELKSAGMKVKTDRGTDWKSPAAFAAAVAAYGPDAVVMGEDLGREWLDAVDARFRGLRVFLPENAPHCLGDRPVADTPEGWLTARGHYSVEADPDRNRRDRVTKALGAKLAALPYAVETYDTTMAALGAWPGTDGDGAGPRDELRTRLLNERAPRMLVATWHDTYEAESRAPVWIDERRDGHWRQVASTMVERYMG
ncbi:protein kinase [Streptomyces sp. NPDC051940]|uniref:protein kinase domain-containing protein n=1 Tax=Streptomyces sp. NPDC051940 TaxID=3155675 RepID=UPI00341B1127